MMTYHSSSGAVMAKRKPKLVVLQTMPPAHWPTKCPICGEEPESLRNHLEGHKPPICPRCGDNGHGDMRLDFDEIFHPQVGRYFYHQYGCGQYS
jgi:hypothetical protein